MTSQPWLVATDIEGSGGIASVLRVYETSGFLSNENVRLLSSHGEAGRMRKLLIFAGALLAFFLACLSGKVCLLHIHSASHGSFWRKACFVLVARLFRRPVLFHLHGGGFRKFYEEESGPAAQAMIRFVMRRIDTVIILVDSWRGFIEKLAPGAEVITLPNPVIVPPAPRQRPQQPVVLFLGLITGRKGVFDLVQAMPAVLQFHPDCRFVLAGNGELGALRAEAERLGVSGSLETPGWVSGSEKASLFERASVFVLPSYFEAMPMSLLEAMAHGLPCIASNAGGVPGVLTDGVEGLLLPPGIPEAWAEAIRRLLSDDSLARDMGDAARKRVISQFSAEAGLARLGSLYDRHCKRKTA